MFKTRLLDPHAHAIAILQNAAAAVQYTGGAAATRDTLYNAIDHLNRRGATRGNACICGAPIPEGRENCGECAAAGDTGTPEDAGTPAEPICAECREPITKRQAINAHTAHDGAQFHARCWANDRPLRKRKEARV